MAALWQHCGSTKAVALGTLLGMPRRVQVEAAPRGRALAAHEDLPAVGRECRRADLHPGHVHRLHLRVIIAVDAEEVHHLGSRLGSR